MLPFRAKRIRCLVPLAHNGSGVFGAKRLFLASMSCVKVFRSTFRAMGFRTWTGCKSQCLVKRHLEPKWSSRSKRLTLDQHSYDTSLNLFPKPQYWDQSRKTLKQGCANFLYGGSHQKKMLQPRAARSHYKVGKFIQCVNNHIFI